MPAAQGDQQTLSTVSEEVGDTPQFILHPAPVADVVGTAFVETVPMETATMVTSLETLQSMPLVTRPPPHGARRHK